MMLAIRATTKLFFTAESVMRAVNRATRRNLSRFGAFVRQRAKSSIKPRKSPSRPPRPPTNRTGLLKRFIFFSYDPIRKGVIIGPARLSRGSGEAPAALEYGGPSMVRVPRRGRAPVRRRVNVAARPFMRPAYERELQQLPRIWANSVK